MKQVKIKALRIFMASITTSMILNMTGCGNQAKDLITYEYAEDGTEVDSVVHYENIKNIEIERTNDRYEVTICNEQYSYKGEKRELEFDTFQELEKFLNQCVNLKCMDIAAIDAVDLATAIPNPEKIESLSIQCLREGLEFLRDYKNLEYLTMNYVYSNDFSAISDLKKLRELSIHDSNMENLDMVRELKLKKLEIKNCPELKDINGLEKLTRLESLELDNTGITDEDIEVLSKLKLLSSLYLNDTNIENIDVLAPLKKMERIELENTKVKNIDVFKNFKKLYRLVLTNTKIESFEPLEKLDKLEYVDLSGTGMDSLYYLRNATAMLELILDWNNLEDVSIIQNEFLKLERLSLRCNKIPIEDLENLSALTLKEINMNSQLLSIQLVEVSYENEEYHIRIQKEDGSNFELMGSFENYSNPTLSNVILTLQSFTNPVKVIYKDIPEEDQETILKAMPQNIKRVEWYNGKLEVLMKYLEKCENLEQVIVESEGSFDLEKLNSKESIIWLYVTADKIEHTNVLQDFSKLEAIKLSSPNLNDQDIKNMAKNRGLLYIDLRPNEKVTTLKPLENIDYQVILYTTEGEDHAEICNYLQENQELAYETIMIMHRAGLDNYLEFKKRLNKEKAEEQTKKKTFPN